MARLRAASGLAIDRHYRGARVLLGQRSFVLSESAVSLLEKVLARADGYEAITKAERDVAANLVASGLLNKD